MAQTCVLEYVRHKDAVWNLPRRFVRELEVEFEGVRFLSPADEAALDQTLPEADVVLGWAVRPDNFTRARKLRWIQVTAASVAPLMFEALIESPIIVTNGRGLHAVSMAEHTLGVMLSFARKLHRARDGQRERRWVQDALWSEPPPLRGLGDTTLGLVGFGAIARAIAERARALGLHVLAVRRHPATDPAPAHEQWGADRLHDLLARSDWVVLAAPLTPETRGLIGAAELERMKPDAVLINLGRGALVDDAALVQALRAGRLRGAGLDVFPEEPLPAQSPYWDLPEVILTPHVSGLGPDLWDRGIDLFRRNLRAYLAGDPLENVVDKQAGY